MHFSGLYNWIVTVESNLIPGSYFELQALSEIPNKNLFETFFSNVTNVVNQIYDCLPDAIKESMLDECDDTEENSLPVILTKLTFLILLSYLLVQQLSQIPLLQHI